MKLKKNDNGRKSKSVDSNKLHYVNLEFPVHVKYLGYMY